MPKDLSKRSSHRKSTKTAPAPVARKVEWQKNPNWTWLIITYLTDHPTFRTKLFSDSTADAIKEGRNKSVAKEGKPQQYAVLAQHIFDSDGVEKEYYKAQPSKYNGAVETRLRRLKTEYSGHLKTLGSTGAGLAPQDVMAGSPLANLVDEILKVWPWWKELHAFWRELPNYNPIAVTSSDPGVDHAAQAVALFEAPPAEEQEEHDGGGDQVDDPDSEGDESAPADASMEDIDAEIERSWQRSPSPAPIPVTAPSTKSRQPTKPATMKTAVAAVGGRDAGLNKTHGGGVQVKATTHKTAIDKFTDIRAAESARLAERQKMDHELKMEREKTRRLKYESKKQDRDAERVNRLEELCLQIKLAEITAARAISQPDR